MVVVLGGAILMQKQCMKSIKQKTVQLSYKTYSVGVISFGTIDVKMILPDVLF